MQINKDTKICVSIASQPGNFGATVHNYCYEKFGLNYIYIPLSTDNLKNTINWMRSTPNVIGCSVSMPYKKKVLKYIDTTDANIIVKNINTIKKLESNILVGYNTDLFACRKIIQNLNLKENDTICILGNGAMSNNFFNITFPLHNIEILGRKGIEKFKFKEKHNVIINATPIGMNDAYTDINELLLNNNIKELIENADTVIDCPVNIKFTQLEEFCSMLNIKYVSGIKLALLQAAKQFEIYTGINEFDKIYNFMCESLNYARTN